MNWLYDIAVTGLLDGTLDLDTDPLSLTAYQYLDTNPTHVFLSDIEALGAVPLASQPLIGRRVVGRTLYANDLTFPAIGEGYSFNGLVLSRDADDLLVAHIDTRPDRMRFHIVGNGGPVTVTWANEVVLKL